MPTAPNTDLQKPLVTAGEVINYRDSWRIFRIVSEFVEGYQFLAQFKKEVTVLGSARFSPDNKYYKIAEEVGKLLGENGFTTITGGGPGIMEAANKGASEANGESLGLNIQLPFEQRMNPYVTKSIGFFYFFSRKVMLTSPASAFIFFPGGFGTLDEFFEVVDYMELGWMKRSPIVLVGKEYWEPIIKFLKTRSIKEISAISESEIEDWFVTDSATEAFDHIKNTGENPEPSNLNPENTKYRGGLEWSVFRIMSELVDGFEFLTRVKDDVTVLGTRSIGRRSKYYEAAYQTGKLLAENKLMTITGGGPGIMEAANKGAFEAHGESIGINMRIGYGERHNEYLNKSISFFFPFIRKLIITAPSRAFIFFPGGFGTLHQLFELLTLEETKKMSPLPLVLYGQDFWKPLLDIIHNLHHKFNTISKMDESFLQVVDNSSEASVFLKELNNKK